MTKEQIFDNLKEILSVMRPNTDLTNVNYDTELVKELGIDSLMMMLMSLALEEKFNFRFPDNQPPFHTVGEVCDYIASLM